MLQQSVLIDSIPYGQLEKEEIEELEVTEKGVSLARFREYTSDIFITTYLLLQQAYKVQGEEIIYGLLANGLRQAQSSP